MMLFHAIHANRIIPENHNKTKYTIRKAEATLYYHAEPNSIRLLTLLL